MKKTWLAFIFMSYSHFTCPQTYLESLESVIQEQIKSFAHDDLVVIAEQIDSAIHNKASLEKIHNLVHSKNFVSFFLLNSSAELQEIKFALGVKMYIYCLDCCEYKMLRKSMKMYDSLEYWKNEKFCESRGLLQKNVGRWFSSSSYQDEVTDKITHLESLSHQTLSCLGLVRYNKQKLLGATNRDEFEKKLMEAVQLQDMLVHPNKEDDYRICDIYYVMKNMIQQLYTLNLHLSSHYIEYQPPSHFKRNSIAYASTAVGVCSCAIAYYLYKDSVNASAHNAYESGAALWNDQVKQPFGKLKNALFGTGEVPRFDYANEEGIRQSLIAQELREPAPCGEETSLVSAAFIQTSNFLGLPNLFTSSNNVDQQEITPEQQELVYERLNTALTHPCKNIDPAVRAFTCLVFGAISDVKQQANIVLKELYEDNRLTIGIASLIPLMTVIAGGSVASNKLYNTVSYQPIRKVVRELDMFLNDVSVQEFSLDREGKLYFLTELLRKKSNILTAVDMRLMEEDVAELQSPNLTYAQKFNVVQRMHYTYNFLLPGAI